MIVFGGFGSGGTVGGSPTLVFEDTFTEASATQIESHTPDTGAGWTLDQGSPGDLQVEATADRLWSKSLTGTVFLRCGITDALADDQRVEAELYQNSDFTGVMGRYTHFGGSDDWEGYGLFRKSGTIYLYRRDRTSFTLLDSAAVSYASGEVLRLDCEGASIKGFVDDVEVVSATDSNYSSGGAGVRTLDYGATFMDNFKAWNL